MAYYGKEIYERKQAYAERRNEENKSRCNTLTEEQHDVLAWLCKLRHDLHSNYEDIWYGNDYLKPFDGTIDTPEVEKELVAVRLPAPEYDKDFSDLPTDDDYYILSDEEQVEWEEKAEEINKENPHAAFKHSGLSLWMEESWEYAEFNRSMENSMKTFKNIWQGLIKSMVLIIALPVMREWNLKKQII